MAKKTTVFSIRCYRDRKRKFTHKLTKVEAKNFAKAARHLVDYLDRTYPDSNPEEDATVLVVRSETSHRPGVIDPTICLWNERGRVAYQGPISQCPKSMLDQTPFRKFRSK